MIESNLRRKEFISFYNSEVTLHHQEKSVQKLRQKLRKTPWRSAAYWLALSGFAHDAFLYNSGPSAQGWHHFQWSGTSIIHQENTMQDFSVGWSDGNVFSFKFLFPDTSSLHHIDKINQPGQWLRRQIIRKAKSVSEWLLDLLHSQTSHHAPSVCVSVCFSCFHEGAGTTGWHSTLIVSF